ncbi:MAG: hypothetical protein DDT35_00814 [Firmicutes bacterium]|nr:hypothetical protein [Bacillota bacterium]
MSVAYNPAADDCRYNDIILHYESSKLQVNEGDSIIVVVCRQHFKRHHRRTISQGGNGELGIRQHSALKRLKHGRYNYMPNCFIIFGGQEQLKLRSGNDIF